MTWLRRRRSLSRAARVPQSYGPKRLGLEHERKRAAAALAHDDDNAALAGLILQQAAVYAVFLVVRRSDVAAKIRAVDLDLALNGRVGFLGRHSFADFVRQNEGRLVLAVQIAAQL